jgi:hypothetical protein
LTPHHPSHISVDSIYYTRCEQKSVCPSPTADLFKKGLD